MGGHHDSAQCQTALRDVKDALEAIGGKWKLQILVTMFSGSKRFREIERSIPKLTSKVLAKELKDLEEHQLIKRTVYDTKPVSVEYTATKYAESLQPVLAALQKWGMGHRLQIMGARPLNGELVLEESHNAYSSCMVKVE